LQRERPEKETGHGKNKDEQNSDQNQVHAGSLPLSPQARFRKGGTPAGEKRA
jgi:hypothetical protein